LGSGRSSVQSDQSSRQASILFPRKVTLQSPRRRKAPECQWIIPEVPGSGFIDTLWPAIMNGFLRFPLLYALLLYLSVVLRILVAPCRWRTRSLSLSVPPKRDCAAVEITAAPPTRKGIIPPLVRVVNFCLSILVLLLGLALQPRC